MKGEELLDNTFSITEIQRRNTKDSQKTTPAKMKEENIGCGKNDPIQGKARRRLTGKT